MISSWFPHQCDLRARERGRIAHISRRGRAHKWLGPNRHRAFKMHGGARSCTWVSLHHQRWGNTAYTLPCVLRHADRFSFVGMKLSVFPKCVQRWPPFLILHAQKVELVLGAYTSNKSSLFLSLTIIGLLQLLGKLLWGLHRSIVRNVKNPCGSK